MPKHIFLTGPKQIGKSTIIQKFLAANPLTYAGFLTVKSETVFSGVKSVHMLNISRLSDTSSQKKKKPSKENFLFFCGQAPDALYRQYSLLPNPTLRFNRIGCTLLDAIPSDIDLIIMDELGPHECEATAFRESIFRLLNGDIPILGVLQKSENDFFQEISNHPDTKVMEITTENRDQIANTLGNLIP